MRRGNLIWGIIIIVAGVLLLLDNMGFLAGINAWGLIWPIALILLGAWFLLGPRIWGKDKLETRQLVVPLESSRQAEITLNHGAGRVEVRPLAAPGQLLSGTFVGGVNEEVRREGDRAVVRLSAPVDLVFPGPWMGDNRGFFWQVGVSPDVELSLTLKTGASENFVDLTGMRVTNLRLETGASSSELILPANAGYTRAEIHAGAASVDLRIPQNVAARIRVQTGLSGVEVDPARFVRSGDLYTSPDYDTAANKLEMNVEVGVGSVKIRS